METNSPSEAIIVASIPFPMTQKECPELYAAASELSRNLPDNLEDLYDLLMEVYVVLLENVDTAFSAQDALILIFEKEIGQLREAIAEL